MASDTTRESGGVRTCTRNRRQRGFTLLEVLMVVVIIGLLAAFVVPTFFNVQVDTEKKLAQAAIDGSLGSALKMYRLQVGHYPTEEEGGLMALVEKPDDEEIANKWSGPYIESADKLKDPWGSEYVYEYPGQYNEQAYDLSSPGPDKEAGTDDDIVNWKRT